MTLDVNTIVVMLMLTSVVMAATLGVGIRGAGDRGHGFGQWTLGLGLYALGWLLVATRGWLPDVVAMAAANGFLFAGLCLQLAAVIEFGGRRAPAALLYGPGPLLFAVTLPVMADYTAFSITVTFPFCAALTAVAVEALRLGQPAGAARRMLAVAYALGAIGLLARGVTMALTPVEYTGLFGHSAAQAIAFLGLFAATCAGSTAFLLMLRQRAEAEIRHLAMFDSLTNMLNRRAFLEMGGRELSRARRTRVPFAVLMMDVDYFKRVNDALGHQTGDRVLVAVATTTRRCTRTEDLVGRFGGEEFCAILPGADLPKALEIAERIRAEVAAHPLADLPQPITVSIGVAACEPTGTLDDAIGSADAALYRAKNSGRNRVVGERLNASAGRPATLIRAAR